MFASLRAMLTGILDYAGLFPPAQLPLDQAIRNYARYRQGPESWMLGRFVCPAARLGELGPFQDELFRSGPPLAFSALGRGGDRGDDWGANLKADAEAIARFRERHGRHVVVDALETRSPPDVSRPGCVVQATFAVLFAAIPPAGPQALALYLEAPSGPGWRGAAEGVIKLLTALRQTSAAVGDGRIGSAGFKLRCGGVEASAFPSPEQVAFTITACRDAGVPLKFTAGLHHPVRRFDAGVQAPMHGFLNVFGAGVLAHARRLSEEQIRPIIEDEDAGHFVFDDAGFRWKEYHATTEEIAAARREAVISFGSCSFDEPRDDLRALGLLP